MNASKKHTPHFSPGTLVLCTTKHWPGDGSARSGIDAGGEWVWAGWHGMILQAHLDAGDGDCESVRYDILWSTSTGDSMIAEWLSHGFFRVVS